MPETEFSAQDSMGQKNKQESNIVFKCNYCDGGETSELFGFCDVCSDKMIRHNIKIERPWCSNIDSPCKLYYDGKITRSKLSSYMENGGCVCYESAMLRDWVAEAGHVGKENERRPKKIKHARRNSLAVLTTRTPGSDESWRFIFAVFLIGEYFEGDSDQPGGVSADSEWAIELTKQEAFQMPFWKYHMNSSGSDEAKWSYNLFQYISDNEAVQILRDIVTVIAPEDKDYAREFLQYYCRIHHINASDVPPPDGALMRRGYIMLD